MREIRTLDRHIYSFTVRPYQIPGGLKPVDFLLLDYYVTGDGSAFAYDKVNILAQESCHRSEHVPTINRVSGGREVIVFVLCGLS